MNNKKAQQSRDKGKHNYRMCGVARMSEIGGRIEKWTKVSTISEECSIITRLIMLRLFVKTALDEESNGAIRNFLR